jgi:hypothetical protein
MGRDSEMYRMKGRRSSYNNSLSNSEVKARHGEGPRDVIKPGNVLFGIGDE